MPAGEIRRADVANFPSAHEIVERVEDLFHRRHRIEAVQLEEIDVVGAQPAEAGVDRAQQLES
jgi:hypothetical protein